MVAQSRPQQAPSPGRVAMVPGVGHQSHTSVSAGINMEAIRRLFGDDDEAKLKRKNILDSAYTAYNDLEGEGTPEAKVQQERMLANPVLRKLMDEANQQGDSRVLLEDPPKEAPEAKALSSTLELAKTLTPEMVPALTQASRMAPERGGEPRRFTFSTHTLSKERQKDILLQKIPYSRKEGEALPGYTAAKGASGLHGEKAREDWINAQQRIARSAARAGAAARKDPMADELKQFSDYSKQFGKDKDLHIDTEEVNAPGIMKLGSRAMQTVHTSLRTTGSGEAAAGAIATYAANMVRELKREDLEDDPAQVKRREQYISLMYKLLETSKLKDPSMYAMLMDRDLHLSSPEEVMKKFQRFGFDKEGMALIIDNTKEYKPYLIRQEEARVEAIKAKKDEEVKVDVQADLERIAGHTSREDMNKAARTVWSEAYDKVLDLFNWGEKKKEKK